MRLFSTLLLSTSLLLPMTSFGQSVEDRGLAIATEVDQRDTGWESSESDMKMELRNQHGDISLRYIRSKTLENPGVGDKSLTIFDEPKDVSGTVLLTHSHATKPDKQWIYFPAVAGGSVTRISTSAKSGPFMASEFAYEDMTSYELEKYTYKFLREESLEGTNTLVVESYPAYKRSGYTRLVTWYDAERYIPLKIVFYDRKDSLLKTLTFVGYKQYLGSYWRPDEMHMENHQTGKSTVLSSSNIRFKTGISDSDFRRSSLERVR